MLLLICNLIAWLADMFLVTPTWWVASRIAAIFFPYEESSEHWLLALVICAVLIGAVIALFIML